MLRKLSIDTIRLSQTFLGCALHGFSDFAKRHDLPVNLRWEFKKACADDITDLSPAAYKNHAALDENYQETVEKIRQYFKKNGYRLADVCLDLLMEKKKNNPRRKDGDTPDYGHEAKQIEAVWSMIQEGLVPKHSKCGSAELLFCASLLHDIGEDFGVLHGEVIVDLIDRMSAKDSRDDIDMHTANDIVTAASLMEMMTQDREYTEEEMQHLFDTDETFFDDLDFEKSPRIIMPELEKRFLRKMGSVELDMSHFQVFAHMKRDKQNGGVRPIVTVTRYGMDGEPGVDTNRYMRGMVHEPMIKANPALCFGLLAKFLDRIEGLSSRIAIKSFTQKGYDKYLDKTERAFIDGDFKNQLSSAFSPLLAALRDTHKMTRILYQIGRAYEHHHDDKDPTSYKKASGHSFWSINFRDQLTGALRPYCHVSRFNHPIATILRQFEDELQADQESDAPVLSGYENVLSVIKDKLKTDSRWWKIDPLLDRNKTFDTPAIAK